MSWGKKGVGGIWGKKNLLDSHEKHLSSIKHNCGKQDLKKVQLEPS